MCVWGHGHQKLESVTLQLAPVVGPSPRSPLLDLAPHITANQLVAHAMQSSLCNQAVLAVPFLVKPPVCLTLTPNPSLSLNPGATLPATSSRCWRFPLSPSRHMPGCP